MPFYADQMFYSRTLVPWVIQSATATVAGTGTLTSSTLFGSLPQFIRRSQITNVQVQVVTAPAATSEVFTVLNGTNVVAACTIGTLTAGQVVTVAPTANNTFAAAAAPTYTLVGIGTNPSIGQLTITAEINELYS